MVPINDCTMTTRGPKRVSVTCLGDKRDTFFSNKCPFLNWLYNSTGDFVLLPKKDTKKSSIAKRDGQTTPMCNQKNTIGRPRPHSLGLLAYLCAARKQFAGRYFREKIFSRVVIFGGRYFRGKIFSREQYIRENIFSRKYFKFTFRENKVLGPLQ